METAKRAIGIDTVRRIEDVALALNDMASLLEIIKHSFSDVKESPSPETCTGSIASVERMIEKLGADLNAIVDEI